MSSGFVSEVELEERRKLRQEEWDRVRQPDDPTEAPEEPYDNRSLFDRLEEQKQKKQQDYDEAHSLRNLVRGLESDEVDFLNLVDRTKMAEDRKKDMDDMKELEEFRKARLLEQQTSTEVKISFKKTDLKANAAQRTSKKPLLAGVIVKRKSDSQLVGPPDAKKAKESSSPVKSDTTPEVSSPVSSTDSLNDSLDSPTKSEFSQYNRGALTCVGILPSVGNAEASSDSDTINSDNELLTNCIRHVEKQFTSVVKCVQSVSGRSAANRGEGGATQ